MNVIGEKEAANTSAEAKRCECGPFTQGCDPETLQILLEVVKRSAQAIIVSGRKQQIHSMKIQFAHKADWLLI